MELLRKTNITDEKEIRKILQKEGYKNIYIWEDFASTFYNWHIHNFDEVRWIIKGEIIIGTEDKEYHLKAGDMLIVPAKSRHWAKTEKGVKYICASKD
ncbi:Cupin domain-containing protein [Venenivibrio stagnispumantis]|uniref:Cupin domain-containing protein n=1 Tax=Venenivibrio stagnispumantis TaxID=407998 RepID=A0AA45WKC3_9AQUI|nr:cupin domain-containing protein [Venenivibrio stagnispumantis]MCW4573511.1 cupin domain-containing protein [Venenivibrio stagnispumantis]SMP06319.1 Cupin domain-containing protein [Venenivibrio stagnispumantis]